MPGEGVNVTSEHFGPYELLRLIGRGGMGEVFEAHDTEQDRTVALKRLIPHLAHDQEFQQRFRRESKLAARLRSPHVVPIHRFGEIDGQLFIDMRLVGGPDLEQVLTTEGPLAPPRAVAILEQVAWALDAAHEAALVHRDVKPSNVLLDDVAAAREFVYLADFGITRALSGESASLTTTHAVVGSLDYMAPEQFDGLAGPAADIYSLGCLLFECMTGRKPFPVEGFPPLMHAHLTQPPPLPSRYRAEIGEAFDEVIIRALAKSPEDRYGSAGALAEAARLGLVGSSVLVTPGASSERADTGPVEGETLAHDQSEPSTQIVAATARGARGEPEALTRAETTAPSNGHDDQGETLGAAPMGPGGSVAGRTVESVTEPRPLGGTPAGAGDRPGPPPEETEGPRRARRRTHATVAVVAVVVLGLGALVAAATLFGGRSTAHEASAAPPPPAPTRVAPAPPTNVPGLVEVLRNNPAVAGPDGPQLEAALQQVATSSGEARRQSSVAVLQLADSGHLSGDYAQAATAAVTPLTQLSSPDDIVADLSPNPAAAGPNAHFVLNCMREWVDGAPAEQKAEALEIVEKLPTWAANGGINPDVVAAAQQISARELAS